ncbi:beta subunit of N-acylethanolamine-hydrolyzing acid amidase-domain-containing protein [Tricladium varicosporioides]|nr:beta subunit of N-acylethanolamine-hydrolyzing acid amidase-domain-containing protein [Hymenoscyphus varicosporioides]
MDAFLPCKIPVPSRKDLIPIYQIDLSLPPSARYVRLAADFSPQMKEIIPLFDQVLAQAIPFGMLRRWIKSLAWLLLRRVYSSEETEEIRGISEASGIDIYFLIALNVFLDSMLGCTSGGVITRPKCQNKGSENRMMHFRTLDWGMEQLRSVLVMLEFVKSKSEEPNKVIARTVTYAGYIGVLTGVRENLSISLNFRPNHTCSTLQLRLHQLLVIFGFRPSISHILRSSIFPPSTAAPQLEEVSTCLRQNKIAPCYLILCDGDSTVVIERDLCSSTIQTSSEFIVHTNNDTSTPAPKEKVQGSREKSPISSILDTLGMESFLKNSRERSACLQKRWDEVKGAQKMKNSGEENRIETLSVKEEVLVQWVKRYPTMNGLSHFGCVMDPKTCEIRWLERGVFWLSAESLMSTGEVDEDNTVLLD